MSRTPISERVRVQRMRAVARRVPVLIGRQHTSAEVETRIVSAVGRALNRRLIASNDGNPLKTGAGAVS